MPLSIFKFKKTQEMPWANVQVNDFVMLANAKLRVVSVEPYRLNPDKLYITTHGSGGKGRWAFEKSTPVRVVR